ncbi:hypothetical protein V5F40_21505 [Xanthobacter sp. DSM 14520]|uniref:hypothetical protein n=1 Tax=Xanthobacter autotrophicus (strain ATCC BAA-1158 / Py2) TaxID=78245 RepID=UPI00372C4B5B
MPPSEPIVRLGRLLDQVREAPESSRSLDIAIALELDGFERDADGLLCRRMNEGVLQVPGGSRDLLVPQYTGSLDAAADFVRRRLPDLEWACGKRQGVHVGRVQASALCVVEDDAATAPLALMAAALGALDQLARAAEDERALA